MDEYMIEKWNETVTRDDNVYILGDFVDHNAYALGDIAMLLHELNGRKHLICGNHDKYDVYDNVFWIMDYRLYEMPILYDNFFLLSHEPLLSLDLTPYANIYGHVHTDGKYITTPRSICVSAELRDYKPERIEYLKTMMQLTCRLHDAFRLECLTTERNDTDDT